MPRRAMRCTPCWTSRHCGRNSATAGLPSIAVHSAAPDRRTYLLRPDLGRRLREADRAALPAAPGRLLFVVCDGLSAIAVQRHAPALLAHVIPALRRAGHARRADRRGGTGPRRARRRHRRGDGRRRGRGADRRAARPDRCRQPRRLPDLAAAPRPHRRRAQLHLEHPARRGLHRRRRPTSCCG